MSWKREIHLKILTLVDIDDCLTACCLAKGIPNECIHEEKDSMKVYPMNNTHKTLTIVQSNDCFEYSSTLRDCKINCMRCKADTCLNGGTCNHFDGTCKCRYGCFGDRCQDCMSVLYE